MKLRSYNVRYTSMPNRYRYALQRSRQASNLSRRTAHHTFGTTAKYRHRIIHGNHTSSIRIENAK